MTESEKEKLKGLVNPDNPVEHKYRWDVRYQQEVLSMLMNDKVFLIQSIDLVRPNYFVDPSHTLICSILLDYFNKYKQLPPKFTMLNEINERRKDDPKLFLYQGEMETLYAQYVPGLESRDHCLDKIVEFAREQSMRYAVFQTLDILDRNTNDKWDKIRDLFKGALLVDRNFDLGLDYFNTVEQRYERMLSDDREVEVFKTGLEPIDNPLIGLSSGGLCRGEIGAFLGLPGVGKSVLLVKAAVANLIRDKKVLYISLEMDQDKIAKRFDAQLALGDTGNSISDLQPMYLRHHPELKKHVISVLRDEVQKYDEKTRLIVKQFPAGTANVDTIRGFIAHTSLYGFNPDCLVLDYVGEMKDVEGIGMWESRQRLVRDLRGFGVENNHCTFTAMQPNRRGREQQDEGVIDDNALADSFGQARPLDALWSINQRTDEKAQGLGRIFVVKHRDGKSRYAFPFKQNDKTLNIEVISEPLYHELMGQHKVKKTAETETNVKEWKPNEGNNKKRW